MNQSVAFSCEMNYRICYRLWLRTMNCDEEKRTIFLRVGRDAELTGSGTSMI